MNLRGIEDSQRSKKEIKDHWYYLFTYYEGVDKRGGGYRIYDIKPTIENIDPIRTKIQEDLAKKFNNNIYTVIITFIYKMEK